MIHKSISYILNSVIKNNLNLRKYVLKFNITFKLMKYYNTF